MSRCGSLASGYSLSMRSDRSKNPPLNFNEGPAPSDSGCGSLASGYSVSMSSDRSKDLPLHFSDGPAPSDSGRGSAALGYSVSVRSDQSKNRPLNFSDGPAPSASGYSLSRRGSTASEYSLSMRSDQSKNRPLNFKEGPAPSASGYSLSRRGSAALGYSVSVRSDQSKNRPLNFSDGPAPSASGYSLSRRGSTASEYSLSMRSDWSKELPMHFSDGPAPSDSGYSLSRRGSTALGYSVSMRSDQSKKRPLNFNEGPAPLASGYSLSRRGSAALGYSVSMRSIRSEDKDPDPTLTRHKERKSKVESRSLGDFQPSQQNTKNVEKTEWAQTNYRRAKEKKFSIYIRDSLLLDDGPPARFQLKTKRENLGKIPDDSKLRRFSYGSHDPKYPNRTVLLVGATGSGKSTLINALVNFVMGVKFEDKVWFEMVPEEEKNKSQTETQTTAVSVYEVFGFEGKTVPYSLTIIDTPGYGDTRGIEYDDVVTKQLLGLFCVPDGVRTIDAVGLVLKSTENRLDERMAYIFNSVTSLFGRDMEQNIVALMTHSDGRKPKLALQALDDAKIKCARDKNKPVHFLFNNCQKEKIENTSDEAILKAAFETSENGIKTLTEFLRKSKPQSLKTTVEVMKERIRLTACIQNLKERVETIKTKQDVLKANQEQFSKYQSGKKKHKNYTPIVRETYKEKEKLQSWWDNKAVTCSRCEENCHYPGCTWAWSPSWCEVMKNGRCTSCSGKCPVKDHVKENWVYVTTTKTVDIGMAKKYLKPGQIEKDISDLQDKKKQYLDEAFQLIQQLEQIALNMDSVFTFVHLDFLIENMEEIGDTEKVQTLKRMRDRMDKTNQAGARYLQSHNQ